MDTKKLLGDGGGPMSRIRMIASGVHAPILTDTPDTICRRASYVPRESSILICLGLVRFPIAGDIRERQVL